ncbi:hypothetical protein AWENTII_003870 [Aspergillus wentii]
MDSLENPSILSYYLTHSRSCRPRHVYFSFCQFNSPSTSTSASAIAICHHAMKSVIKGFSMSPGRIWKKTVQIIVMISSGLQTEYLMKIVCLVCLRLPSRIQSLSAAPRCSKQKQ